ncbi:MAG: hypothetical protein V3V76_07050, partial [Candidatus Adiutricales bacterium]
MFRLRCTAVSITRLLLPGYPAEMRASGGEIGQAVVIAAVSVHDHRADVHVLLVPFREDDPVIFG